MDPRAPDDGSANHEAEFTPPPVAFTFRTQGDLEHFLLSRRENVIAFLRQSEQEEGQRRAFKTAKPSVLGRFVKRHAWKVVATAIAYWPTLWLAGFGAGVIGGTWTGFDQPATSNSIHSIATASHLIMDQG